MITIKETGVQYSKLSEEILNHHNNNTFAFVERVLDFDEEGNLLTEITIQEINSGIEKVRQYLYSTCCDNLFMKWQAGEGSKEDWLAARQVVKDAWPKTKGE